MKLHVDLSEIKPVQPNLASRYDAYRRDLLRELRTLDNPHDAYKPTISTLAMYLTALEEDIGETEQFKDFQKPLTAEGMMALACEGPVVVINVSKERSDAIIVTQSELALLELPEMTYTELQKRIGVLTALRNKAWRDGSRRVTKKPTWTITNASNALLWLWRWLFVVSLTQRP
jgi:hypothetical protein